jgi:hypothetical protein
MELFAWFENTAFSIWVRESPLVFPTVLIAHALGMGALVGVNVFLSLRALGVVRSASSATLDRFVPIMWIGFFACLVSGLVLLAAYPAKALTNPVFFLKFAFIGLALVTSMRLRARLATPVHDASAIPLRTTAVGLLLFWAAAIAAGRFLAYTHSILLASHLL